MIEMSEQREATDDDYDEEFCANREACSDFDDESCHISYWGGSGCFRQTQKKGGGPKAPAVLTVISLTVMSLSLCVELI